MIIHLEVPENKKTLVVKDRKSGKTVSTHSSVYHRKTKTHLIIIGENGQHTQYSRKHYKLKGWFG